MKSIGKYWKKKAKENHQSPILEEINTVSGKLYILFGGIASSMGIPPFEFYNSSRILNDNKIFLRDFSQSWYQTGLPGIGNTAYDIGNFLKSRIKEINPQEIYFVGNSMGGFAAILFASMLGCGKAVAFCPQTFIDPLKRIVHGDGRWRTKIFKTYILTLWRVPPPVYDLKRFISKNRCGYSVDVLVSRNHRLDLTHAKRISEFNHIFIREYDKAGHDLVRHLRDTDQLQSIMMGRAFS